MILPKYNYKFDCNIENINIPDIGELIKKSRLNKKQFVKAFIAVIFSQLYDERKVVYKYLDNQLYLDIYIEQTRTGLLFIDNGEVMTDEQVEQFITICSVMNIKPVIIKLYSNMEEPPYIKGNVIQFNINQTDALDTIDNKTLSLITAIGEVIGLGSIKKYVEMTDIYTCYKLAIILSLEKKV